MKFKFFKSLGLVSFLSFSILCSLPVSAATLEKENIVESTTEIVEMNNSVIQPRDSKIVVATDISVPVGGPSFSQTWTQTQGFEWLRIWYKNDSDYTATVKYDGKFPKEISPHSEGGYFVNPVKSGSHKVTVSAANGGAIEGWIGVREGESENDF